MNKEQTSEKPIQITAEKLLAFVHDMFGGSAGRPDDEHPLPPGPWDPVIRAALEKVQVFGPRPEPWRSRASVNGPQPDPWRVILARHPEMWDAVVGQGGFGSEVELNPQPLPPRVAFLVELVGIVTSRAELIQEVADATRHEGDQQGIIVGGYISRFVDEFCGNGFRLKYPFPGPRPHWYAAELTGVDLVVLASAFNQAAKQAFSRGLRQSLGNAGAKLTEAGVARLG